MPTEPTPATDTRADLHRGLAGRYRFERTGGGIIEVDAILTTPRGWEAREVSPGERWHVGQLGPFVLALRALPDVI